MGVFNEKTDTEYKDWIILSPTAFYAASKASGGQGKLMESTFAEVSDCLAHSQITEGVYWVRQKPKSLVIVPPCWFNVTNTVSRVQLKIRK